MGEGRGRGDRGGMGKRNRKLREVSEGVERREEE